QTAMDLWVLPLSGDKKPLPFLKTPFEEYDGQFSPDGKWIAYASNESGQFEIYVQPFPGPGGKFQISSNGGDQPRGNRNGKEISGVWPRSASPSAESLRRLKMTENPPIFPSTVRRVDKPTDPYKVWYS